MLIDIANIAVFKNLTNQDGTSWGENYAGSSGLPLRNLNEEVSH